MLEYTPGIAACGLVTGVAMVKGGLSVPLALFMSLAVYSGAAQLATLPLIVAGTLAMLGLTYGLLSDRSTWTAAVVAGLAAVAAFALPLKLNIMVAIAAAVAAGLLVEQAERAAQRLRGPA